MFWRAAIFLIAISVLAFLAFKALVESEIERVISVHVLDKSMHLVDMYEAILRETGSDGTQVFASGQFAEFANMARTSHVKSVRLYDTNGILLEQTEPLLETMEAGAAVGHHAEHDGQSYHLDPSEIAGSPEAIDWLPEASPPSRRLLIPLVRGRVPAFVSVEEMSDSVGRTINFSQAVLPVTDASGRITGFLGFVVNVSDIYDIYANGVARFGMLFMVCGVILFGVPACAFWLQKQLAERSTRNATYLSRHDALTGLLNRTAFYEIGEKRLAESSIGVAGYIDIDRFKLINDTFGHAVGDVFLKHVAQLIQKHFAPDVLISRLGGDEFVFILNRMGENKRHMGIRSLMSAAAEDFQVDGVTVATSISMGVAAPERGDTLATLLQRADTALYFSKSSGRNAVSFYDEEMGVAADRRRRLELRLREAVKQELFELHYQPLVDAASGATLGYEALVRLDDKDGTPISPAEFIPLAEEIGLIEDIGRWVLFAATREMAAFDDVSKVSVNLSPDQLRSGQIVQFVKEALEASGLNASRLELEITESVLLEDGSQTGFQIDALKDLGVSIAMDDFGTGFSSLSALWQFDFDRIKIDRSFVQMLEADHERSSQLIETIVMMGERMNMCITAEGIETKSQKDLLAGLGCHVLQGFYFGFPQKLAQFEHARQSTQAS